ncbi:peroxidasin-like isoform X2 [Acropora muricata]|uniref:peroxidasin-like isoform X2 n=1 Tax=Acropora muricata TaxID=159855 RepID=UPI0034E5F198
MQETRFHHCLVLLLICYSSSHALQTGNSFTRHVLVSMINGRCRDIPIQTQLDCFMHKYRTLNGTCNNLCHVTWGSVQSPFQRLLPPAYQYGESAPRSLGYNDKPLPNTRKVSSIVFVSSPTDEQNRTPNFTHMTMMWGQFLSHDIVLTQSNESAQCGNNSTPCKGPGKGCIGIDILSRNELLGHQTAKCIPLRRSAISPDGEQMNKVSSFIDGSQIYGANDEESELSRDRSANIGLLRVAPFPGYSNKFPILPKASRGTFCRSPTPMTQPCFHAGDHRRANENPALMAMHTIWVREHNRIANYLHILNPLWQDERLFQETRKIVIGQLQHITYNEWLPVLFNEKLRKKARISLEPSGTFFNDYDPSLNPTLFNSFATAALRIGHSMIRQSFSQTTDQFTQRRLIPTSSAFFNPTSLFSSSSDGIGEILQGLVAQASRGVDRFFVPAVRENLVTPGPTNHGIVGDLSAINIQRGRDHGLPPYVQFRNASGLGLASSIDNLTNIHPAQRERLREAYYDNVDDIDLYVGGMSETPLPGSIVGDTFTYILAQGFKNLRFGDRFWYERDDSHIGFTLRQLDAIRNASLARVLCDNTEGIEQTLRNVFLEKSIVNSPTNCENLKFVDLNAWKEGS